MRFLIKYSFITLFISIATAIYLLGFTTQGLVIDVRYISTLFPGTLKVEKINGTLFSGFSLQTITYQNKEETVSMKSMQLSWHPEQLLQGKLAIDSLILEQPKIILLSTDTSSSSFSLDDFSFMHRINFNHLIIHQLNVQKSDLRFDATGELNKNWNFQWKLNVPKLSTLSTDYAGSLIASGTINGENKVPVIDANIQGNLTTGGKLEASAHITAKPTMGMLTLKEGRVAIHALGIQLNDIMLTSTINKSNMMSVQGSLRSGNGAGRINGTIDLNNPLYPVALTLQGENMTALHIPKFKFAISPDIRLNFVYPDLEVQGKVVITKAKVKLKNYINTVSLPDETVFVDAPQVKTPSILSSVKLHLAVDLGHDFYFNYTDLETRLGGQLVIDQSPNSPATATGEVNAIKGAYTIYGQHLEIKTGRLIYAGSVLTNPGLTIEAIRKVKNVSAGSAAMPSLDSYEGIDTTVGVRITGTAENPQIALFSIPAGLTKEQILSSLGGEGAALMGAISAINPHAAKVGGLTDKLTKMLGLSEVNIASVQTFNNVTNQMQSTPSFIVGKNISKKLSVHYSIGIFNPISIFNVRYQLNKNWAIQSETSTIENGADLLYGFERS